MDKRFEVTTLPPDPGKQKSIRARRHYAFVHFPREAFEELGERCAIYFSRIKKTFKTGLEFN